MRIVDKTHNLKVLQNIHVVQGMGRANVDLYTYQRLKRVSVELVQWPTRQIDRSHTGRAIDPYASGSYEIES